MVIRARKGFLDQRLALLRQWVLVGGTVICTSLHSAIGLIENEMTGFSGFPG